jgi:predicted GNAT superfamily acetyltransferase
LGSVEIAQLTQLEDLRALEKLFAAVWGRPDEPPISSDTLRALVHSGNYVAGSFIEGRLTGGLVGWLGGAAPGEGLHLHSHILGVASGSEAHGLGFQLKQDQRRWCLERGLTKIEWTTDPLVRRNAYFNLTKLGARASQYLVNFYGAMTDGINAGEESDRLLITWQLDSAQAESAAAGSPAEANVELLLLEGAGAVLSAGPSDEPVKDLTSAPKLRVPHSPPGALRHPPRERGGDVLLCQVPEDIVAVRRADPALARSWRLALRSALVDALAAGYEVTGATRSGWYVLRR